MIIEFVEKLRLLPSFLFVTVLLSCVSCSTNRSGDYKLIDVDLADSQISEREYEKGLAEGLGAIWHLEKVGKHYKLTCDNDPDAVAFTYDGDKYVAYNGKMTLSFTSSGAILYADDGKRTCKWILEKM